ncbi:MAG: T9SS type A sorting domain-containing protein [bacterium]|nr:T9SS type A sorting domain-containing protein [bacterium]
MKQKLIIFLLVVCSTKLFSQCVTSDSTVMGPAYANDVFYSLQNGTVKTESNNNWNLAFSVQGSQFPLKPETGVAIRVNSVKGNTLVKLNGANTANWRKIDTTGLFTLPERLDSFKTWDISAFTKGYNYTKAPFNFIWGNYNNTTHDVEGNNVFVLYNKNAGMYKKIFIKSLGYDTLWNVIISNIDNSDSTNLIFSKGQYPNRLFVYYDLINKQLINREPAKNTWDLVWTRYKDVVTIFNVTAPYPVTGVLSNKNTKIAKNLGKKCNEIWLTNVNAPFISDIDNIGWDWKIAPQGPGPFVIVDTFVYFIKNIANKDYKVSFNGFIGSSAGKSYFSVTPVSASLKNINNNVSNIYPNPANGSVNISSNETISNIELIDITGASTKLIANNNMIDISNLASGIYILNIQTKSGISSHKLVKE